MKLPGTDTTYYLGVDIGGTKCAVVAGTKDMETLERVQFATEPEKGAENTISNIINSAHGVIEKLGADNLAAIGITCGGPLDSKKGLIMSPPNLPGWDNILITKIMQDHFVVPVFLQNDANACALAEWYFGAGRGTKNMIFLTFGTGLGAGLILDGRLYTGTNGLAGEVGHIRLAEDGPLGYDKKGSFEGFCSGAGITRLAREIIIAKMKQGLKVPFIRTEDDLENITAKTLAESAMSGDETAQEIFSISGKYLGQGLSILIDIINPERIVIGSVFARNPQLFEVACQKMIEKETLKGAATVCEIVPSALGDQVGDYASLSVAINGVQSRQPELSNYASRESGVHSE